MRFSFIAEQHDLYPVVTLCKVMKVSRSGYYDYLKRVQRQPSPGEVDRVKLIAEIKAIHEESKKRYGSPRIHAELRRRGYVCSLSKVKRLMRQEGIYAVSERKYKRRKSVITLTQTSNLLLPKPDIFRTNQVWYSDITFIRTAEGWLYLAAVMDAFSKRIVGYAMADHMRTDLVIQALRMATKQRCFPKALIHHSDKGSQYTSYAYQRELAGWGMRPSFTGIGACLDNAHIESFFASLKKELVYQTEFISREQAKSAINEFINMFYNSWRLHSSLGYQTPNEFEAQGLERLAA